MPPLHQLRKAPLTKRRPTAALTALSQLSILSRVFYHIHQPDYDFFTPSKLIKLDSNPETQGLFALLKLRLVCKAWKAAIGISSLPITWMYPRLALKGETHLLHIPFFCWLGRTIKSMMKSPLEPGTHFNKLQEIFSDTGLTECFVSQPAINRILVEFTVSRHPKLTEEHLGSFCDSLNYTLPVARHQDEDAFILTSSSGIRLTTLINLIITYTNAMYKMDPQYRLWKIVVGFVTEDSDTLYPQTKRCVKIFPSDFRLEVANVYYEDCRYGPENESKEDKYWRRTSVFSKRRIADGERHRSGNLSGRR